jgi:uncharacterized coiled-coil DUF342 family protein
MEKLNDLERNLHTGFGIKCYGLHQRDIDNLLETIKALYQEYEELDAGHSKLFKDFCGMKEEMTELRAELETTKHIATTQTEAAIDYQQEIEQLTKQIAASDMMIKEYCKNIVDYLVVLAKARDALEDLALSGCYSRQGKEALAAITEVVGNEFA